MTVFASDPNTGRLSLVQNQQLKTPSGLLYSYFPVGKLPTMVKIANSCLYSLNSGDASLTPYSSAATASCWFRRTPRSRPA